MKLKEIALKNRERILSVLFREPLTFSELRKELRLSKPVLSDHLKYLRKQKQVAKDILDDRVVYKLAKGAYELPLLHALLFETSTYLGIVSEFVKEREAYRGKTKTIDQEKEEFFGYLDVDPKIVAEKSDKEFIQAIEKWLTPIVLYAIIQELKTGHDWIKTIKGLSQKLMEVVKQKDLSNFEDAFKKYYSHRLVIEDVLLPTTKVPIINMLYNSLKHATIYFSREQLETE